jgi:hypothetical protein
VLIKKRDGFYSFEKIKQTKMFVNPSSASAASGGMQDTSNFRGKMTIPSTTVELSIRCVDLTDRDVMSKSDPLCIMYQKAGQG